MDQEEAVRTYNATVAGAVASTTITDMPSAVPGIDHNFTEAISQKMQVPARLRVGVAPQGEEPEKPEDTAFIYSMHVPDRLLLADALDVNPQPLFSTSSKYGGPAHLGTVATTDVLSMTFDREESLQDPPQQGTLRRSYSDQTFGRSPPVTPPVSKQSLHVPSVTGRPPQSADPPQAPALPPSLTPRNMFQTAKDLGRLASQRVLLTITQKCGSRFSSPVNSPVKGTGTPSYSDHNQRSAVRDWLPEDCSGGSVELLVLRRQVLKISRRLAAMERQNTEHRKTELLLFSLLLSSCLLSGWLWLRR